MDKKSPLIHVALIQEFKSGKTLLFLRRLNEGHYAWFKDEGNGKESETPVWGPTIEEAIRLARLFWKEDAFRTIHCGFRYTLPERDEHGNNALFHQMIASYSSMNGIYFDDELGHNCVVHHASNEARSLWQQLQQAAQI